VKFEPSRMIAAQVAIENAPIAIGSSAATTLRKKNSVSIAAIGSATISAEAMSERAMSWARIEAATWPPISTSMGASIWRSNGSMRLWVRSLSALLPASETITSVSCPSRETRLASAVS
jgi:hypothetical protein